MEEQRCKVKEEPVDGPYKPSGPKEGPHLPFKPSCKGAGGANWIPLFKVEPDGEITFPVTEHQCKDKGGALVPAKHGSFESNDEPFDPYGEDFDTDEWKTLPVTENK